MRPLAERDRQGFRLVNARRDVGAALIEGLPFLSERNVAGRAIEETDAKPVFQLADLFADRGRGQTERTGGGGKAPVIHHIREQNHLIGNFHRRAILICAAKAKGV